MRRGAHVFIFRPRDVVFASMSRSSRIGETKKIVILHRKARHDSVEQWEEKIESYLETKKTSKCKQVTKLETGAVLCKGNLLSRYSMVSR